MFYIFIDIVYSLIIIDFVTIVLLCFKVILLKENKHWFMKTVHYYLSIHVCNFNADV